MGTLGCRTCDINGKTILEQGSLRFVLFLTRLGQFRGFNLDIKYSF